LKARVPWLPPVALSSALSAALLIWDPRVRDLAAYVFRADLFDRNGFQIWNASWYGGHYLLSQSFLFPPLGALLGVRLLGAISVVAGAYLFDRLVRVQWGERARPASLWYAAGATTLLASGRMGFALGVALGLASLRALQLSRTWLSVVAAVACSLASPVAGVFLVGVVVAAVAGQPSSTRPDMPWLAFGALAPLAVLNLTFPDAGREPFAFSAWIALPLWCAGALYLTRGLASERPLRVVIGAYLVAGTVVWLIHNPLGGNVARLGALFGGPVLAAVLLSRRPKLTWPVLVLVLAGSLWWQVQGAVRDVVESQGDDSTSASYYEPLARWLRAHDGERSRIEVPFTFNHWETTYLAPEFSLARGWLRQLDRERNKLFYAGRLTDGRYRDWLLKEGVRYVALADADSDYSAESERRLVSRAPPYLQLRSTLPHWRIYELKGALPLVQSVDDGRARLVELGSSSFTLAVERPGTFTVRIRKSPYWVVSRGSGCVARDGDWASVRADSSGLMRVSADFSLGRAIRATIGKYKSC
jgi:hypothetical protein